MPRFEVVEGRPWHCGQIVRTLRRDHAEVLSRLGLDAHKMLRACFDDSSFRRAWLIDGRLGAIGGVMGTSASCHGFVWIAFSEEATKYPIEIVREARKQLRGIMSHRHELVTSLVLSDITSVRFAKFLGFKQGERISDWAVAMQYAAPEDE
jgi:hypothetical protein